MSRLREGRANTARGAAHFLRETVGRVRYAGASGRLTLRADSGFYTHGVVAVCRKMDVRFSDHHPPAQEPAQSHRGDTRGCLDADSLLDGRRRRCGRDHLHSLPVQARCPPVRLIVRRVKPTPGSQLALFATYSYHGFITDRDGELLELEAHRRHAEIENAIRDLKRRGVKPSPLGALRRQRRLAGGTGDGPQPGPLDGADRPGRADRNHQDPPAGSSLSPDGSPARHVASLCICPSVGPESPVQWRPGTAASHSTPSLTTRRQLARHPANRTSPQTRPSPVRERLFPCPISPSRSSPPLQAAIGAPKSACRPPAKPPICPNGAQDISPVAPSPLFRPPSVDSG